MPSYFRFLPEIQYASRLSDTQNLSQYVNVKNLFKRAKIRDDIFNNTSYFTKYKIIGDERPDNVAFNIYGDETLDWLVLLSNNIVNIQTEWPTPQTSFTNYLINKYGSEQNIYEIHHYETIEVATSRGQIIVPKGTIVPQNYSIEYFDPDLDQYVNRQNITIEVTNYDYELRLEDEKRNINILKPIYLDIVLNDLEDIMKYKKGSTQYVSETLKKADDPRFYS